MSVIHDVIKLTAGKVTSTDSGHKHFFSFFKVKEQKDNYRQRLVQEKVKY